MHSKHYLGDLRLIDGAVYLDKQVPSYAYRYVGEMCSDESPGYALQVFRSCRNGKLISMPYSKAEERFELQNPSKESDNG